MTSPATVLIVDDSGVNRRLIQALLEPQGYVIRTAASGEDALASIARDPPDLILLDVMMPGLDGRQVASALKADPATSNIPIIMVTAQTDHEARLAALEAGAEDFLTKPVDRAELWLRVRNLLRLKELSDLLERHRGTLETEVAARTTELQEANEASRSMIESSLDALVAISAQGLITDANEATVKATGIPRVELIGTAFSDCFTDPDKANAIYQMVFAQGMAVDYPLTMRHRDGTLTEVLYNASVYRDTGGKVLGVFAAARDVTEARQAFEATARLAAIVESSDDAIIGKTLDGIITSWNAAAARMYGYSSEEMLGTSIDQLSPRRRSDETRDILTKVRDGQVVAYLETDRVRRDGTVFPVSLTVSPICNVDGAVVGTSTIARDLTEQVQKGRALAEASRQYRLLAENASDLVVMTSPDRVITWVSPSLTRSLGWAVEDLMGKRLLDLVHPDDAAATEGQREALYCKHEVSTPADGFLMRFPTMSGNYRWMAGVSTPVTDESGVFTGVVSGLRDVDDLVRAREEAQANRATLRATLDSQMDPAVRFDAVRDESGEIVDFVYVYANPAACAYNRMTYEELVGSRLLDLLPGHVKTGLLERYKHVVQTGEPMALDDYAYPVDLMGVQVRRLDLRVARVGDGLSYTWRDVTERHEAFEYGRRMAAVVEQTHDAIMGVSLPDTLVTSWNPAAERMYGYTAEEIIGKPAFILTPNDQLEQTKGLMARLGAGEPVTDYETVRIRNDGSQVPVSASYSPIHDANGVTVGLSTIHRDITQEKAAREEKQILNNALTASNDSLRDFVAVASHDLRSPLVAICGFTEVLTDNWATLSDEARLKQVGAIQRGVDRLSRLTNDLLASARVEAAAEQTRPEHVRLATALASYIDANREELGTVAATCPPELVAVVDPSHLTRILDNYLTNAFKYGGPPICIEAERVGDFVELRVRDHGPGVPPEFVSRLFTKFSRADTATTRATQGTGLGLSIVKALAEANHGNASYQQDEPNGGCFVVRLPATSWRYRADADDCR